ncbi:hypothetical protein F441_07553 [Phytophthora nicotianae CJ01A1]|uniref:Uncharacterized protein n=5 Tax=Phytophthora nicotianae TaxID=4792 RepID=V9FCA1_PHYNI|nr:hypothetical protein F443_07580 [Phytophthora nicotianae P1569]ETK88330.1 hypothetical protein L915_07403 [Phytophthora nicotianae]ETO77176.1 hypothetical protein F444_07592 [Phytophthora nicotianae P1976]ETP18190.1 hypothetical protein F441_07553 [Phytophthora nicotianae CJ01A1]ETP46124.1 hypothetical protein F442_07588 [Phytophthora nicotianae P10297]
MLTFQRHLPALRYVCELRPCEGELRLGTCKPLPDRRPASLRFDLLNCDDVEAMVQRGPEQGLAALFLPAIQLACSTNAAEDELYTANPALARGAPFDRRCKMRQ